jgi:alpha-amylase/alpha-mannosidase (GH57 family)
VKRLVGTLLALAMLAAACTNVEADNATTTSAVASTPETVAVTPGSGDGPAPDASDPGFYLMLMWHQHQPRYPLLEDGSVSRPWVRVHATKDYYDMAALHDRYPEVRATFNLTPVLLQQLDELANGAKDIYWTTAEVPAGELTDDQKLFVAERFFDTNPRVIERFARYQELADAQVAAGGAAGAAEAFTDQDFLDLQVLFNLAWTDPDFLAAEPLAALVAKQRDFVEDDKAVLFAEHLRIIGEVIPLHARLWEEGKIEVTTTPLAHPILPLVSDTSLASVGDPAAILPAENFSEIPDADQQVIRGLDVAEQLLGRRPSGMWPAEGAVAQLVMSLFSKNGVEWVASGEEVLANTLGIGSFTRDSSDLVQEASALYRPYEAQLNRNDPVPMFFRDGVLSDLIGFEYSGMSGAAAASDLLGRLQDIRAALESQGALGGDRPPVVSIILDGENAWENYENDGKDFLDALYQGLSDADFIRTTTPSEYLDRFGEPEPLPDIWPGAWFQPNFATWIGEDEEATAWDYLFEVREDLQQAEGSGLHSQAELDAAYDSMLFAEGSDWFWWYGADQDSGDDSYFDTAFRELLGGVYDGLDVPRPPFLAVPIIPQTPAVADATSDELFTIALDTSAGTSEWSAAGRYRDLAGDDGTIDAIWFGYDREHLNLRVDFADEVLGNDEAGFELYVGAPGADQTRGVTLRGSVLGFGANTMVEWSASDPLSACLYTELPSVGGEAGLGSCDRQQVGFDGDSVEFAIPLAALGALEVGDRLVLRVGPTAGFRELPLVPVAGPALAQVPDISNVEVFLTVDDPTGDDHGPGTYTYPTDPAFLGGSYDLTRFEAGTEGDDLVLSFEIAGTIQNPWGSPRGLSVQTFDVYIDTDAGAGTGARQLIAGRNAALGPDDGWEYAITVEGWEPAILTSTAEGVVTESTPSFPVIVFGDKGKVIVRVPLVLVGDSDPTAWSYVAILAGQEGFPSSGVRRIRDVEGESQQWRFGGAPGDINHTRIIDVAWEERGRQESWLSTYPSVTSGSLDDLGADDFPILPLLGPGS